MSKLDLLETGVFSVVEAAYLVGISEQKARGWICGYPGRAAPALIQSDLGWSGNRIAISFKNLLEMRFVAYFERQGVHINHLKSIMDEVRLVTGDNHPFARDIDFQTDGKKIVGIIRRTRKDSLLFDLKSKNFDLLPPDYHSLKKDVIYSFDGDAILWFPRKKIAPNVIVHPKLSFGRPVLKNSQIPTQVVADAFAAEKDAAFIAEIYEITPREVREAVKFEAELRAAA